MADSCEEMHSVEGPFDALAEQLGAPWRPRPRPTTWRSFRCQCARPVFFGNSLCLSCGSPLGYEPHLERVAPLRAGERAGTWKLDGELISDRLYRRCANFETAAGCNWLVPDDEADQHAGLCAACRLNRTIPDQNDPRNREAWHRIEVAKRRLVSALLALGLPVASRDTEDPAQGLAFEFLRGAPDAPPVTTGHANGVITLNVEEADDARRETIRRALREPYRTLLGHLRHEVGHYYWDRLVGRSDWLEPFRNVFGDERAAYAEALRAHYEQGPPTDWSLRHVSAYASAHPWEDWSETWAHYLHMVDVMDTALSFGLDAENLEFHVDPFTPAELWRPDDAGASAFLSFVNAWVELTGVFNELTRSMGQPDLYPFVLPHAAVRKLQFVHLVVNAAAQQRPVIR